MSQALVRLHDAEPDEGYDPGVTVVYAAGCRNQLRRLRDEEYALVGVLAAWHWDERGGHANTSDTLGWFSQDAMPAGDPRAN